MIEASRTRRWYRLTPNRLVLLLLAVEVLLWLSERFGWLGWHKGYAVLTGVAVVGVAMVVMIVWFGVAVVFRWRFQFSIRSLLVLVVVVALPSSWLTVEMKAAKKQRDAVTVVERSGGWVRYDYEFNCSGGFIDFVFVDPSHPAWLCKLLGEDFVANVIEAQVYNDKGLKGVKDLARLRYLWIGTSVYEPTDFVGMIFRRHSLDAEPLGLPDRGVTDTGLAYIGACIVFKIWRFTMSRLPTLLLSIFNTCHSSSSCVSNHIACCRLIA